MIGPDAQIVELTADEHEILRQIYRAEHGISAPNIAADFPRKTTARTVNTVLDRLSDLGYVTSGWHAAPGAPPDSRPGRYWRLSAEGINAYTGYTANP